MDPKEQLTQDSPELKHTFQDGIKYREKQISRLSNLVRRWAPNSGSCPEREWTQVLDAIRFSQCVQTTAKMWRFLKRMYPQIIHL
jgi:oligoribonuclease (3'-5' exoribonuclease)